MNSWSCTGNLAGDAGTQGDNAPGAGTADQVTLDVQVAITGPAAGQTVTFTPTSTSCTSPTPCTRKTVSPGQYGRIHHGAGGGHGHDRSLETD